MKRPALILILLFTLVWGCAPQSVSINMEYDFSKVKRVAVIGFEEYPGYDESGSTMAGVFEKLLLRAGYQLVERQEVERIIKEQNFSLSGAVDSKQAVELGRILGVQALVFGKVTLYVPHETAVQMVKIKTKTTEPIISKKRVKTWDEVVDKKGVPTKIERFEDVDVVVDHREIVELTEQPHFYRIQAEAGAVVKMVDAQSGIIAWVGSSTEQGINLQVAAEMVGRRIIKDLKKIWPVTLSEAT